MNKKTNQKPANEEEKFSLIMAFLYFAVLPDKAKQEYWDKHQGTEIEKENAYINFIKLGRDKVIDMLLYPQTPQPKSKE